jgi:hypothetical protein
MSNYNSTSLFVSTSRNNTPFLESSQVQYQKKEDGDMPHPLADHSL